MYYYFNTPVNYLSTFYEYQDFLLCYSTFIEYQDTFLFYKNCSKPIMLYGMTYDNRPLSFDYLLSIAHELHIKELCVPFYPRNSSKTYTMAYSFFKYIESRNMQNDFDIMLIPQGSTYNSMIECAYYLSKLPCKTLGFSIDIKLENYYLLEQKRFNMIKYLYKNKFLKNKNIHLFELYGLQYLRAYKNTSRHFKIRSLTTSFPTVLGIMGKDISISKKYISLKLYNSDVLSLEEKTKELIKKNILFLREYK